MLYLIHTLGDMVQQKMPKQADDPRATGNLRPPNCPERMEERPKTIPFERALAGVCVKCEVLRATFRAEGGMDLMSAMKRIRWKEGGQCKYAASARTLIEVKITAVRPGLHTRPSKQVPAERRPRPSCKHTPPVAPWTASPAVQW